MMADQEPGGNPEVIQALNNAYSPVLTLFEQAHRQEHRFEVKYQYKKEVERFDKIVHKARCWRRKILNRIEQLGGDVESVMGPVKVSDDIKTAYVDTIALLRSFYSSLSQATAVATSANDHPSHKMLLMLQHQVDMKIHKLEAIQRQQSDLGENYILTVV